MINVRGTVSRADVSDIPPVHVRNLRVDTQSESGPVAVTRDTEVFGESSTAIDTPTVVSSTALRDARLVGWNRDET